MPKPGPKGDALDDLARDPARLATDEGTRALAAALRSADPRAIRTASELVREHVVRGHERDLVAAYRSLAGERAAKDPGCLVKEALLAALDATEHADADLFAEAAVYVQIEKAKGGPRDTGGRVRGRGVLGVARLGHRDAMVLFGARLADHDATVRRATARAIAHRGERDGAGLLLLKCGAGDEEPEVIVDCLIGLFALAPEFAGPQARAMLAGGNRRGRDDALFALGAAPSSAAVEVLGDALRRAVVPEDRAEVVEALGLSPRPEARALLLELLSEDRVSDARAALRALSIHRYDERLAASVKAATAASAELSRLAAELFDAK